MNHRPRTFTFYSYKGGVGRSMALLNVAYTLHSMGRHVLIVDLDLEAPGVSGFLRRNEELAPHDADKPDVLELLKNVLPLARWQPGDASRPAVPVLNDYLREVKPDKFAKAQNPRFRRTRLDVLCASDERDYTNRLAALDIASLSAEDLAETGNVLREIFFRHQFPWAWQTDHEDQPTCYDYILIDSRTGFTETSGLCIGPLADRLVIFCGLNDQNINGTAEFLRVVGLKTDPRATPWDDADDIEDTTRAPSLGDKPSLLVASPVPAGDMEKKYERFKAMERILGVSPEHHISYHSRLSLYETVFLRDFPHEIIAREYRGLTDSILSLVGDHPRQHQEKIRPLRTWQREGQAIDRINLLRYAAMLDEQAAARLAAPLLYVADQLSDQAATLTGREADALFASAYESYKSALVIKPDSHEALNNWGAALLAQAKQKPGAEADSLYDAAGEKFQAALAIQPDKHGALNNWGVALVAKAQQRTGGEADVLFSAACEKYQIALAIKPDSHEVLYNWGAALAAQAQQKTGEEAGDLFSAAGEKYHTALLLKPDYHEALTNWGNAIQALANNKTGKEADALFATAVEKHQASLAIRPDYHLALNNWGVTLAAQAKQKTGAEADSLYASAEGKYQAALAIKPDSHEALYNWGFALSDQAKQKTSGEADALFTAAGEKYRAALAIKPDDHAAFINWGNALSDRARQKSGAEADSLFVTAGEKYQAALVIKPDDHKAFVNWGVNLSDQAKQKSGAEADALFASAVEKFQAALAIKPDDYDVFLNLGCLAALRKDAGGALEWLQKATHAGMLVTQRKLTEETDFDPIRETPEFKEFLARLPA